MQSTFLIIGLMSAALFSILLTAIVTPACRALDLRILTSINLRFHPGKSRAAHKVQRAMRDLTALGGDMLMALLLVGGALLIALRAGPEKALWFAGLLIAARIFGFAAKLMIRRERPQIASDQLRSFTSSFPSVHTQMTYVGTFALLTVIGIGFTSALAWAGALAALVGATRLYFAVHWPSDVTAGWLSGLAICAFAAFLGGW